MARGKPYSPEDVERGIEALAESGGNATAASKATGIPRTTLIGWKQANFDEFDELRREKRSGLIDKVWAGAEKALDLLLTRLEPDEDGVCPIHSKHLATIFGILTDKGLLLGGEPTEILKQLPPMVFRGVDTGEYEERERE